MCGIIAYMGHQDSYPILLQGLQRLEYRGYDSAGIAVLADKLHVYKKMGKVDTLTKFVADKPPKAHVGIGHTRWATHGVPSDANAHPQLNTSKSMAVVHNGIIENYSALKQDLLSKGYVFKSETDTEVLVHLLDDVQQRTQCALEEAVQLVLQKIVGAYALVVLSEDLPNTLIATCKGSPMVVGIGQDEFLIASDILPIVAHTNRVVFMKDCEMVVIQEGKLLLKDTQEIKPISLTPAIQQLDITLEAIEKGDFAHFMHKEIFEQPQALVNCMRGRVDMQQWQLRLGGIHAYLEKLASANKIIIVACGTSWHAGLVAEYFLEEFCRIPVEVEYASEFRYRRPVVGVNDFVLAISQSGETADTQAAITLAKSLGATVVGICNVVASSIARAAHVGLYTHAGPEIGVASTKAFTTQLAVLFMVALAIARQRETLSEADFKSLLEQLSSVPNLIKTALQQHEKILELARRFRNVRNFLYLGRGYNFPVALEGALKLKELSYIHAEGYPAAEMKHGPIALIDEAMPVVFIATQDKFYKKILANIEEVKARKGQVIAIVTKGDQDVARLADYVIEVPLVHEALLPMITVVPLQLLAYYMAVIRGCDVDKPRNLAKSVTVE